MSENVLTKQILNTFFDAVDADLEIPDDLKKGLIELRESNKLLKGDNLKNLLETVEIKKEVSK